MAEQNGSSLKRYHIVFAVACFLMLAGTIGVFVQDHNREFRQYQEAYRQAEVQRPKAGRDGIAPRQGIQQVVLKNLPMDMLFDRTPRVDRCVTCHQAIDNPDPRYRAGGTPAVQPVLRSHPRLDLFVAPNSKHPYSAFGCTICHFGRPMGTGFSRAAHSPQHPQQAEEWKRKYGWSPLESWEQKMLPLLHTEASCLKCHRELDEIPEADKLNAGRELFRSRGCTNCHMGFRGDQDLAWVGRTGPDLRRIGEKFSLQWCIGWTLNPCDFRPGTAMPRFLGLENRKQANSEPLKLQLSTGAVDRDAVETEALCTYLFVTSKLREFLPALPEPPPGDAEAGRKLFSAVGCVACHSTSDRAGADNFALSAFAPDLSRIGDKVSPRWLFAWLKEPHQHWAETKMPNLRLSDAEAAAIAAYLTQTMRSGVQPVFYQAFPEEAFDALIIDKFSPMIPRERLATLLKDTAGLFEFSAAAKERTGLSALAAKVKYAAGPDGTLKDSGTGEWTEAQIAKIKEVLSAEQDKARAVKAFFAGEFLIQHHGCYACHNIQGWAYAPLPCPNLQGEADKDLARFAFGRTLADGSVANTKWDWIRAKIARPRIYDVGSLNQTRPFDRLRMPLFNLTPAQIDSLVTHVLSLTLAGCASSPASLPAEMQHRPTSREIALDRGYRVFRELNCTACHLAGISKAHAEPRSTQRELRLTNGEGAIVPHIVQLEKDRGVRNAGPQQAPPSLVFEGSRVQPDWLYQFLRHVYPLRWGFTIRMPSFWGAPGVKAVYPSGRLSALTETFQRGSGLDVEPLPVPEAPRADALPDDVAELVQFFACDAGEKPFGFQPLPLAGAEERKLYEQGRQLVTGAEAGCTNCHALSQRNPPEPKWAPNLADVKRRLKEPWLDCFLINPQSVYPWTNTPDNSKIECEGSHLFEPRDPLGGDEAKARERAERLRAVKCYLLHLGEGETAK